jgi:predicted PurR-regulated permease PerM
MGMENKTYSVNISNKTIFNLILIGAVIFAMIKIKSLILVVLTSVVIASFIGTSATALKNKLGISRGFSVALMYILTVATFGAVFYFFVPVLIKELISLIPLIAEYFPDATSMGFFDFDNFNLYSAESNSDQVIENLKSILSGISSGFISTITAFFGGVANVLLVAVISFYLSISKDGMETFLRIITPIQHEEYVINLWARSQRKIALWMSGQFVLGIIVGILTFIGLTLIGVEYALLLAVVAALFELIPFGIYLAIIPAITLSFATGGIPMMLFVVGLYIIIQQLESYLFAPLIVQKTTGISPLIVILSILIGISLAGFWGLILAIPVAVTVLEYVNDLEASKLKELKLEKVNPKTNV